MHTQPLKLTFSSSIRLGRSAMCVSDSIYARPFCLEAYAP